MTVRQMLISAALLSFAVVLVLSTRLRFRWRGWREAARKKAEVGAALLVRVERLPKDQRKEVERMLRRLSLADRQQLLAELVRKEREAYSQRLMAQTDYVRSGAPENRTSGSRLAGG